MRFDTTEVGGRGRRASTRTCVSSFVVSSCAQHVVDAERDGIHPVCVSLHCERDGDMGQRAAFKARRTLNRGRRAKGDVMATSWRCATYTQGPHKGAIGGTPDFDGRVLRRRVKQSVSAPLDTGDALGVARETELHSLLHNVPHPHMAVLEFGRGQQRGGREHARRTQAAEQQGKKACAAKPL